jgi:hypothetical protein
LYRIGGGYSDRFDGGLGIRTAEHLAMKVYGHLRDQHSVNMAQRVSFDETSPSNVVDMIPEKQLVS